MLQSQQSRAVGSRVWAAWWEGAEGGRLPPQGLKHAIPVGSPPAPSRYQQLPVSQRAGKDREACKYHGRGDECGQFQADYVC